MGALIGDVDGDAVIRATSCRSGWCGNSAGGSKPPATIERRAEACLRCAFDFLVDYSPPCLREKNMAFVNLDDYEAAAREILPKMAYDYLAGGAYDEQTLRDNRASFGRWRLRPRILAGVGERDLSTEVMGHSLSFPLMLGPTAMHQLAHPDGELATARAAGSAGVLFCASTFATYSMEEIAVAASGPRWFQLYWYKDHGLTESLIERAVAS